MAKAKTKKKVVKKAKAKTPKVTPAPPEPTFPVPATTGGREVALKALTYRREHQPKQIDNSSLYAGSPMYYYCRSCGHQSDCLPETHWGAPRKLCNECQALQDLGWLTE